MAIDFEVEPEFQEKLDWIDEFVKNETDEMPLAGMWMAVPVMGIADGPTEVHKNTIAKTVLKQYKPHDGLWPSAHVPSRMQGARAHIEARIETETANL